MRIVRAVFVHFVQYPRTATVGGTLFMNPEDLKGNELQPGPTFRGPGRGAVFTCSGAARAKAKREANVA
jgi:hypothetical protein